MQPLPCLIPQQAIRGQALHLVQTDRIKAALLTMVRLHQAVLGWLRTSASTHMNERMLHAVCQAITPRPPVSCLVLTQGVGGSWQVHP
jgi:hypothetical protein